MLVVLLSILFMFACFLLIVAVLLQQGKGGGISGAFGIGGASQTIFGASGAGDFLTKSTWVLGGVFMLLSLLLALLSGSQTGPIRRSVLEPNATSAPVTSPTGSETGLPVTPAPGSTTPGTTAGSAAPATSPGAATPPAAAPGSVNPPAAAPSTGSTPPPAGTSGGTGH